MLCVVSCAVRATAVRTVPLYLYTADTIAFNVEKLPDCRRTVSNPMEAVGAGHRASTFWIALVEDDLCARDEVRRGYIRTDIDGKGSSGVCESIH